MEPSRVCMNNDLDEMGNYNLTGLRELNMPGIEQFSEGMFDEIQKAASSKKDVVFDTEKNFMNLFMVGLSLGSSLVIRIRGMWIRAWMKLFRKYGKKSRKSGLKK